MDFKDWRNSSDKPTKEDGKSKSGRYRSKRYMDYVEEQIRAAQDQGAFDNLPGSGKPLKLDSNPYAGDKSLGYNLLKSNGYAPREVELSKEIRTAYKRAEARLDKIRHLSRTLRSRRMPPFASEKRAFNTAVEKAATEYEQTLRQLNRSIMTLNLSTPMAMHQPFFEVEKLVEEFRKSCPLFSVTP